MMMGTKLFAALVILLVTIGGAGCGSKQTGSGEGDAGQTTCSYNGIVYPMGTTFPSTDGCNECWCATNPNLDRTITLCTLMRCSLDGGRPEAKTSCLNGDSTVPVGLTVVDPVRCEDCTCMSDGIMTCFPRTCGGPPPTGDSCALPAALNFGPNGGMVSYQDQYSLDPQSGMSITRTSYGRSDVDGSAVQTCSPPLPDCWGTGRVSLANIVADLAVADVQAAFKQPATPLYGIDLRPMDGTVYSITLGSNSTILVGAACGWAITESCVEIPEGVQRLVEDLKSLTAAAVVTAECKGL